jgi:hypothetical protein
MKVYEIIGLATELKEDLIDGFLEFDVCNLIVPVIGFCVFRIMWVHFENKTASRAWKSR